MKRLLNALGIDKGIAHDSIVSFLLKILHAGLTLSVAVMLARFMGPAHYGIYAFVFSLVTLFTIPVQLGLPILVVRETAAARVRQEWETFGQIWRWSNQLVLIASSIVVVGGAALLLFFWEHVSFTMRWAYFWALPLIPLLSLAALHGAALRGLDRVFVGQLPDHILRLGLFAAMLLAWLSWSRGITAASAVFLHAIAALAALIFAYAALRRVRPTIKSQERISYNQTRAWVLNIIPLGFVAAAHVINTRSDIILLGILTDAESVGVYQVSIQAAQAVAMGIGAVALVIGPRFAALFETGQTAALQRLATFSTRSVVVLTLPVVTLLVLGGEVLIQVVFGSDYRSAYYPMVVLASGQLIIAGFGSVVVLLTMTGYESATAKGLAFAAGLNMILNLFLIPRFGIIGASMATTLSVLFWNLILWNYARKNLGINTFALRFQQENTAT